MNCYNESVFFLNFWGFFLFKANCRNPDCCLAGHCIVSKHLWNCITGLLCKNANSSIKYWDFNCHQQIQHGFPSGACTWHGISFTLTPWLFCLNELHCALWAPKILMPNVRLGFQQGNWLVGLQFPLLQQALSSIGKAEIDGVLHANLSIFLFLHFNFQSVFFYLARASLKRNLLL